MITRASERKTDHAEKMRGGDGITVITHLLRENEFFGAGRLLAHNMLVPGASIGVHEHKGEYEVYYFLEGKGLYNDNGKDVEVGPGDVTICPSGECHGIKNNGDKDLHFVAMIMFAK